MHSGQAGSDRKRHHRIDRFYPGDGMPVPRNNCQADVLGVRVLHERPHERDGRIELVVDLAPILGGDRLSGARMRRIAEIDDLKPLLALDSLDPLGAQLIEIGLNVDVQCEAMLAKLLELVALFYDRHLAAKFAQRVGKTAIERFA